MPITITLSATAQQTLSDLTRKEQSAFDFWQRLLHEGKLTRKGQLPMIFKEPSGQYRLEWTSRKLGPASIAEGHRLGKVGKY